MNCPFEMVKVKTKKKNHEKRSVKSLTQSVILLNLSEMVAATIVEKRLVEWKELRLD